MNIGDMVRHKNTGSERLKIRSISETVATVDRLDAPRVVSRKHGRAYDVYVCAIENLLPYDNQLTLEI